MVRYMLFSYLNDRKQDNNVKGSIFVGKILVSFYDKIKEESGFEGQLKLAMMTSMSQKACEGIADSRDNIERFNRAFKSITGKQSGIS